MGSKNTKILVSDTSARQKSLISARVRHEPRASVALYTRARQTDYSGTCHKIKICLYLNINLMKLNFLLKIFLIFNFFNFLHKSRFFYPFGLDISVWFFNFSN